MLAVSLYMSKGGAKLLCSPWVKCAVSPQSVQAVVLKPQSDARATGVGYVPGMWSQPVTSAVLRVLLLGHHLSPSFPPEVVSTVMLANIVKTLLSGGAQAGIC